MREEVGFEGCCWVDFILCQRRVAAVYWFKDWRRDYSYFIRYIYCYLSLYSNYFYFYTNSNFGLFFNICLLSDSFIIYSFSLLRFIDLSYIFCITDFLCSSIFFSRDLFLSSSIFFFQSLSSSYSFFLKFSLYC